MNARTALPLLLITLSLLASQCRADVEQASRLQELRSLGYRFCTKLLLYYDPSEKYPDPGLLVAAQGDLQQMTQLSPTITGGNSLAEPLQRIEVLLGELRKQPLAVVRSSYPSWLNPLLEQQAKLDRGAAQLQADQLPAGSLAEQMHDLSLLNSQLQVLYLARGFQSLSVEFLDMREQDYALLDGRIVQGFAALESGDRDQVESLKKLRRNYEFIRHNLLDPAQRAAPGSVALYLGRNAQALDQLADR
ncbi:hypothetical protein [Pseudomonas sp. NBRC 100443]|uniref:hypothetical protein n=1 Tax=Pseudomonas sp. NBRC 100443 TaxID=1113665 RepID=UPI0024A261BC|nr:hypothetical protein [Pseudomonas sp. NBRC 100443]GLU37312.1 hypothetical protein Pssp01_14050 [Pseudomonas sp. NBRC 100443]